MNLVANTDSLEDPYITRQVFKIELRQFQMQIITNPLHGGISEGKDFLHNHRCRYCMCDTHDYLDAFLQTIVNNNFIYHRTVYAPPAVTLCS